MLFLRRVFRFVALPMLLICIFYKDYTFVQFPPFLLTSNISNFWTFKFRLEDGQWTVAADMLSVIIPAQTWDRHGAHIVYPHSCFVSPRTPWCQPSYHQIKASKSLTVGSCQGLKSLCVALSLIYTCQPGGALCDQVFLGWAPWFFWFIVIVGQVISADSH